MIYKENGARAAEINEKPDIFFLKSDDGPETIKVEVKKTGQGSYESVAEFKGQTISGEYHTNESVPEHDHPGWAAEDIANQMREKFPDDNREWYVDYGQ